ncbi:MAG: DUF177 domain-containing protein [Synergistaceae bacterium]|jgi:uncharacterized protein|nr:DUF177 domain-containing protein [Synergistaceae bacterium]
MPEGWVFIIELPRGRESSVEKTWEAQVPGGLTFEGQRFEFPSGFSVRAEARWLEDSLLSLRLSLAAWVKGECARCLAEAGLAISDELLYLYYPRDLENMELRDGYLPVEVDFLGRTLDVADQVWESLVTLLPYRMLCREDCAGLCSQCGADLNQGPCSCSPRQGDPRFELLRGALKE